MSNEHSFYGLLAGDELGETIGAPAESYRPTESDVGAVGALPAIRRSLALYRLGLRFEATREWAGSLAKGATKGLGLTKRAMYVALGNDLETQLEYEAQLQGVAGKTKDYSEGVKAFIEKRAAEFIGE